MKIARRFLKKNRIEKYEFYPEILQEQYELFKIFVIYLSYYTFYLSYKSMENKFCSRIQTYLYLRVFTVNKSQKIILLYLKLKAQSTRWTTK